MMTKDDLVTFIQEHRLAVISTVNRKGSPESAVVEFANRGLEIVFDALRTSRKYRNLQLNENVSVVIGWDAYKTLQYEGRARILTGQERDEWLRVLVVKLPEAAEWAKRPDGALIKVEPTWIRYSDWNSTPPQVVEFTL